MATNRFDTIEVKNILKKDFDFRYDNEEFVIKAGQTVNWPRELAEHAVEALIDRCILKRETWKHPRKTFENKPVIVSGGPVLFNESVREKYRSLIMGTVNRGEAAGASPKSRGEIMKEQLAQMESGEGDFADVEDEEVEVDTEVEDEEVELTEEEKVREEVSAMGWDKIRAMAKKQDLYQSGMRKEDVIDALVKAKMSEE